MKEQIEKLEKELQELKAAYGETGKKLSGLNIVTMYPDEALEEIHINDKWAASLYGVEQEGTKYKGRKISGHEASLFLADCYGTWYDKDGNKIFGYLYYKPNNE